LMAVYSLLLQLAAALSAHHECRMLLLSAQLLGAFFLVPGVSVLLYLNICLIFRDPCWELKRKRLASTQKGGATERCRAAPGACVPIYRPWAA